ncbi:11806_t:CDS:2 [Funneliformis caledonium]|uniref:11806_t:CDS:1 n=1 Tax=Funneliformis caledonium TaxID=1117310 RepID=A0A9N9EJP8_9GLOM|nr:11806_t:CDS:2 [Funneliformis caledonium]
MDRLPENKKLDVNKTFKSQRESVNNHIIPVIQKAIDRKAFPVVDEVHFGMISRKEENMLIHDVLNLEVSETDDENPNKRKIIIRDLKWRSSTLRIFLREFIDNDFNPARRTRKRVYSNDKFTPDEEEAPVNTPKRYISIHYSPSPFRNNNIREKDVDDNIYINEAEDEKGDKEDEERNEEKDEEEDDNVDNEEKRFQRSRSLVSGEYNSYENY